MTLSVKSNKVAKQIVDVTDLNELKDMIYLKDFHKVRFIRGSSGEIYIAFDLDKEGKSRRVLELNGSKIIYFMQVNGEVTQTYWEK